MDYTIIKPISNNVVLVCDDKTKEQIVLMSKGIGFNKKAGSIISDKVADRQMFKLWSGEEQLKNVEYDKRELEALVKDIVDIVKDKLLMRSNGLYEALLDHIIFAIDRLKFGLPIENPFINEIAIIYDKEYEVAQIAVDMIKKQLKVDMGNAETGFIALHLHSAKENSTLQHSIENVSIYNEAITLIVNHWDEEIPKSKAYTRAFLLSLDCIVKKCKSDKNLKMSIKKYVFKEMSDSYQLAKLISDLISNKTNLTVDEDAEAFITVELEKLKQFNYKE